jgi:hypothetical protein
VLLVPSEKTIQEVIEAVDQMSTAMDARASNAAASPLAAGEESSQDCQIHNAAPDYSFPRGTHNLLPSGLMVFAFSCGRGEHVRAGG